MGYASYNADSRNLRAQSLYSHVTTDNMAGTFKQKVEKRIHQDMNPANMKKFREARDSDAHPNTVPIQLYLDVTGSMMGVPVYLIKEGLPKIISKLIEAGVPDVALMFGAIGDHVYDRAPLQIAQFESGDEELDMWLERVYPEGGGGGNGGESYGLALFNATRFIQTDAWDKRKQKGFVFIIGDEPALQHYPGSMLKDLYGSENLPEVADSYTFQQLYDEASEKNHLVHIAVAHSSGRAYDLSNLQQTYNENFFVCKQEEISDLIVKKVLEHVDQSRATTPQKREADSVEVVEPTKTDKPKKITL